MLPLCALESPGHAACGGDAPHTSAPILSEFADDPDMTELVASFVEGLPLQVAKLEAAHASGDHPMLRRLAHQLKGAAGGYGFPTLTTAAAELEERLPDGPYTVQLLELCDQCRRASASAPPTSTRPA